MTDRESGSKPPAGGESARPSRARRLRSTIKSHWILASLALLVLLLAVWLLIRAFSKPKRKPAAPPAIPVAAAPVILGNIDIYLDALGTVTPVYTVTVASRVAGELTEVRYKEGQTVKKGQLLAVIDPRPYQAALTRPRANWRATTRR